MFTLNILGQISVVILIAAMLAAVRLTWSLAHARRGLVEPVFDMALGAGQERSPHLVHGNGALSIQGAPTLRSAYDKMVRRRRDQSLPIG